MARNRTIEEANKIRIAAGLTPFQKASEKPRPPKVKIVKVKQPPKIVERVVKEITREVIVKRPVGRPHKPAPIVLNSDKAKHQFFLSELLNGNAEKLIKKVIGKALDDDDKDQMVCMKMCIERVLPVSYFEKAKESNNKGVSVTIMGIGGETKLITSTSEDIEDAVVDEDNNDIDDIDNIGDAAAADTVVEYDSGVEESKQTS